MKIMKAYTGWIIFGTLIVYLLSIPVPVLLTVSTLSAWSVPFIQWRTLGIGPRNQVLFLVITGLVLLFLSACKGVPLKWDNIFCANIPLLAMFVAVSFLGLTNSDIDGEILPQGKSAVMTTAFATHLFGGVINLSALFVFGDRLQKNGRLSRPQMMVLGRSFCAAAWWSPFFIATGVALTYSPEMLLHKTLIPGLMMSFTALALSIFEICYFRKETFSGYPFKTESLTIPMILAALVLGIHLVRPEINILNIICIVSPIGAIIFMNSKLKIEKVHDFITTKLVSLSSQFTLFLAAGIFSSGIKSINCAYPELFSLENTSFTPSLFAVILGLMIIVGIIGVHPIVSISIVSPLLLPLNMDHSQLGFLFLSVWAISTACSPLSGVGLALVGRYQVSSRSIIMSNWHYAVIMWAFASIVNRLFFVGGW